MLWCACFGPHIVAEVETLGKELIDTVLAFRDIAINNKLALYPLVIDRVKLLKRKDENVSTGTSYRSKIVILR